MNETTKKLIFAGSGIAILAGAYFAGVKPMSEDTKTIKNETKQLQATLDDLKQKEARREEYIQGTAENEALFEEKLAEFPSNWNQEYQIEFIENVRKNPDIIYEVVQQEMERPTSFYVLGGSNAEGQLSAESSDTADTTTEATADTTSSNYECYALRMGLEYVGDYQGIKDFVDHVASYPYRMTIDTVEVAEEDGEPGLYRGTLVVNQYFISGGDRGDIQDEINLDEIETGVDNVFEGGASGVVSKYAADNGEAIISDYDLYVAVNPSTSDTSAKIVGLNASGDNVTSSKNSAESITIDVSENNGVYTVVYGIGTEKKTKEFDPGEDLTLLIQSSDIKDTSDVNSISVSINNTTDKTLYVKVADDTSARRVKIVEKTGSVIVYK